MSRPTAISPEEQEQTARRIGVLLLQAAPENWQQITVEYRATGEYRDLLGEVTTGEGGTHPWEPPQDLHGIFEQLRDGMYRPDVGTWLSALYVVERPSSYRIDINFDTEPQWRQPLPRAAYADELRRYPRTEENVPEWMREKLDGASAPADPAAASGPETAAAATAPGATTAVTAVPRGAAPGADTTVTDQTTPGLSAAPAALRTAEVFEGRDEQGRPVIDRREPIPAGEVGVLRQYLESAPVVHTSDATQDELDADAGNAVPPTWHTDGTWVWSAAVPYYLAQYGVPPQDELIDHARSRGFALPELTEVTRQEAAEQAAAAAPTPRAASPDQAAAPMSEPVGAEQPAGSTAGLAVGGVTAAGVGAVAAGAAYAGASDEDQPQSTSFDDHRLDDQAPVAASDDVSETVAQDGPMDSASVDSGIPANASSVDIGVPADRSDSDGLGTEAPDAGALDSEEELAERDQPENEVEAAFARLHDKLAEHAVPHETYRLGSHDPNAWCLIRDDLDWIVAGPADDRGETRFSRADQAAAFLLGSVLMSPAATTSGEPDRAPDVDPATPESAAISPEPTPVRESTAPADTADSGSSTAAEPALAEAAADADDLESDSAESGSAGFASAGLASAGLASAGLASAGLASAGLGSTGRGSAEPDSPETSGVEHPGVEPAVAEDSGPGPVQETAAADPVATPASATALGAHPDEVPGDPEPVESSATMSDVDDSEPGPSRSGLPRRTPETSPQQSGGHFLFTANQDPDVERPSDLPPAHPDGTAVGPHDDETTRRQVPPRGNEDRGGEDIAATGAQQDAGGGPGGLPKRQPRGDRPQAPPQPTPGAPAQPGPGGPGPAGGADRRPGPNGPGMAPPPGAVPPPPAAQRPPQAPPPGAPQGAPQGSPQQQPQQPVGTPQQLQPLQGEPPLTLYRDRRPIVLQPGTDLDRFGDAAGNVTYAIRTPYSRRSLPPQWSSRPYHAFRVQRPMHVLRGTAVPWFEQPGGGTAFVLPGAISDLITDGTLVELQGPDAQRPPME